MKNTWREVNKILGKGNKADILENCSDWQEVDSNHRDIDNSLIIIIIIIIIIHPIIIHRLCPQKTQTAERVVATYGMRLLCGLMNIMGNVRSCQTDRFVNFWRFSNFYIRLHGDV